jgi:hypothetical protein
LPDAVRNTPGEITVAQKLFLNECHGCDALGNPGDLQGADRRQHVSLESFHFHDPFRIQ